jgi:tetratricopeptide (TPR) repeat protein
MTNENDQDLTRSSQQQLTKYSSDLIKKGLNLASIINLKKNTNNDNNNDKFWIVTDHIKVGDSCIYHVSISESGNLIAFESSGSLNNSCIIIWSVDESRIILELEGQSPFVLTPDGNYLECISIDDEQEVIIYELKNQKIIKRQIMYPFGDSIDSRSTAAFSPSLKMLAYVDTNDDNLYKLHIIDIDKNSLIFSINSQEINDSYYLSLFLNFSFDSRYLSICDTDTNNLFVVDIEKRKIIKSLNDSYSLEISLNHLGLFYFPALATFDSNIIIIGLCFSVFSCGLILVNDLKKEIDSLIVLDQENSGYISYISSTLDNQFIIVAYEHGIKVIKAIDKHTLLEDQNQLYRDQVSENLTLLADLYSFHCNLQKANEKYSEAIEINPYNFDAYNKRSTLRSTIGDYQGAMEDLQKARQFST